MSLSIVIAVVFIVLAIPLNIIKIDMLLGTFSKRRLPLVGCFLGLISSLLLMLHGPCRVKHADTAIMYLMITLVGLVIDHIYKSWLSYFAVFYMTLFICQLDLNQFSDPVCTSSFALSLLSGLILLVHMIIAIRNDL